MGGEPKQMLPRPVSVTGGWLLAGPETPSHCLRLSLVRGQWSVKPRDPQWGGVSMLPPPSSVATCLGGLQLGPISKAARP